MKVSVIVPIYNVGEYLPRCLDSLLNQTYNDYEIICINDQSTDRSAEIMHEYAEAHPDKIMAFDNEFNSGLGITRDAGVSIASGRYLMFVDSDDYVKQDYIERYVNAMEEDPCDVIIGGYIRATAKRSFEHLLPHSEWTLVGFSSACAKLWRKDFFQENNLEFSSIRFAEDTYLSLCAFYLQIDARFIDYAGYYYWANPASLTMGKNYDSHQEQMISELYSNFMKRYDLSIISEERRRMVEYFYISDMLNALLICNRGCGRQRMAEKYDFFMHDLKEKFPNYKKNQFAGFFKPSGQRLKTRLGVGGFMRLDKMGIAKPLFMLASAL